MSEIYEIIIWAIGAGCVSSFIILALSITGIREKIIEVAPRLMSKLFSCDFCLSFWISLILAIILAIKTHEPIFLLIPTISTPISRILL